MLNKVMSDIILNIDTTECKNAQNAENNKDNSRQVNDTRNTKEKDDPGNETKTVDIKQINNKSIQNATQEKSHEDNTKSLEEEISSNSNVDVAGYLKSEIIGINVQDAKPARESPANLPQYTEINMTGHSRKFINKHTKAWKFSRGKLHRLYIKEPVLVQFMGSENLPENKIIMVYEPETRNHTVKGMFAMLMVLHFFTWFLTFLIWASPAREGFIVYGHFIAVLPFLILLMIVILVACFQICRTACCGCCSRFSVVFFQSIACAAFSGYFNIRLFIYANGALALTDLVLVILGCTSFNFQAKKLYAVKISCVIIFLMVLIPASNAVAKHNIYYWASDEFYKENIFTHIFNFIYTIGLAVISVKQLHFLLEGEFVELGEDDYSFGGYLLYVSPIDYPIRMLRKRGALKCCEGERDEDEEEE